MKKSVCLNMIVKNESAVIEKCLNSVKSLIDYWVIVDTGSTDGTQQVICRCLNDIPGDLHERPWVDFAFNRNEALFFAKEKGDYLLFIDADDYLLYSNFQWPSLEKDCYVVDFVHGTCRSQRVLICNNHLDWKWEGVIHETIDFSQADGEYIPEIVYMTSIHGDRTKCGRNKYLHDAEILEKALRNEPQNARYQFHLATSYEGALDYEKALFHYERRAQMEGDVHEMFYSLYRIGVYREYFQMAEEVVFSSYMKAFHFCESRIEPLYALASYYLEKNNYLMAYLLTDFSASIPRTLDYCYTQTDIYDFGVWDLLSESAFRIQKYPESYRALVNLLSLPTLPEELRKTSVRNLSLPVFNEFKK